VRAARAGGGAAAPMSRPLVDIRLDALATRGGVPPGPGGVTVHVRYGEFFTFLGPRYSGKTDVLRAVAGFMTPSAGRVLVDGQDVGARSPGARSIGYVFQEGALWEHLTAREHVAFGLEQQGLGADDVRRRVETVLARLGLADVPDRRPPALTLEQRRRLALARALAPEPRVLLLDEPLSNLDPALRERTRRELRQLIKRVGITTVFVTHEQEEAFDLGDRVAVLSAGRLEQAGPPDDLYERPATLFVATFVGRANVFRGAAARALCGGADAGDSPVVVRPERLRFTDAGLAGIVRERRYTGASAFYIVESDGGERFEVLAEPDAAKVGDRVYVQAERVIRFTENGR